MSTDVRLILLVCFAVVIGYLIFTVPVILVKSLPETVTEKFDKSLVRGAVLIKTLKVQAAKIIRQTPNTLKHYFGRAASLKVSSGSVPMHSGPLCTICLSFSNIDLSLDSFGYFFLVIPIESRIQESPRRVAILKIRTICIGTI